MLQRKTFFYIISAAFFLGCVENTAHITQERSDKVAKYILKEPPKKIQHRVNAKLENKVTLLGYNYSARNPKPGSMVDVTWFWQVHKKVGPGWRLFTHGVGAKDKLHNFDKPGKVRKNFQPEHWEGGMIVRDRQRLKIPPNWRGDFIELRTGIWKGNNRLKVKKSKKVDGSNRIRGPKIRLNAAPPKPPITLPLAEKAPKIDGKFADEEAWKGALKLDPFVNTMNGQKVPKATEVLAMWDEKHLYLAMRAEDDNLKSEYKKHDDELWHQDAFEIFLDPAGDKLDYYEIQVSPKGVVFDSHLPKYRENQNDWTSKVKLKVKTDGTVNDEADADKEWSLELAIPFASLEKGGGVPPKAGDKWKMNFFRVDATKDKTAYSAWSAPMRGDFHTLDKFGQVVFGGPPEAAAEAPKEEASKDEAPKAGQKGKAAPKKEAPEAAKAEDKKPTPAADAPKAQAE
jgi:hypothetical protein